jgi:signal transduction histidine kinase
MAAGKMALRRTRTPGRRGLATRLAWAFGGLAGILLLAVGAVLTLVSYNAQVEQIILRQEKTAGEAALVATAYLAQAQDTLQVYGQVGSLQSLLLRSMEKQQEQLHLIIDAYPGLFQELAVLDADGQELARVSDLFDTSIGDLRSWAGTPAFEQAISGQLYVANQPRVSASGGFPSVIMAVPISDVTSSSVGGPRTVGVLMADVSIEGMWNAMAQVEVGDTGYAYIIHRDTGEILAHSQFQRYLSFQGQGLRRVSIVRQLMARESQLDHEYTGLEDEPVIGAAAGLSNPSWALVAELPTQEALTDVRRMVYLLALLFVAGAVAAGSLGLFVPRRMLRPLLTVQEGAREIGSGHLDHVIDVRTGDEMQDLAETFNQMATNLKASHAELERWGHELEAKVEERTAELAEASKRTERRAIQLETSAAVAHAIASVRDMNKLLPEIARLVSERFGWYHVGIFLLDEQGEFAVLRAANSEGGRRMLARNHKLRVGTEGIVGRVTGSGEPRVALDVGADAVFFDNPDLPATRSEMALPLIVEDEIIGALDVQSTKASAYDDQDVALMGLLADQMAIAIANARLFEQTHNALEAVQKIHRQYVQREWTNVAARERELTYEYRRSGTPPLATLTPPEMEMVLARGELVALSDQPADPHGDDGGNGHGAPASRAALAAPIKLRGQVIGVLDLQEADAPRDWTEDEVTMVEAISDQVALALENARLLEAEQGQRMAAEALREAAVVLSSTLEFDELIQRILDQIARVVPSDARNLMLVEGDAVRVVNSMGYERFGAQDLLEDLRLPMDSMITIRQMQETGRPIVIPDTADYPGWSTLPELDWLRSYVGAPIIARGQLVGLLNVDSATPGFFGQEHANQLEAFASQAAIALENTQLVDETSQRAEQLAALHRIGLAITSALDLQGVLDALYERIRQVMHTDSFYVALYDEATGTIEFPLMISHDGPLSVEARPIGEQPGLTGYIIKTGEPLNIANLHREPEDSLYHRVDLGDRPTQSYLGVPLVFREQVFGVLSVQSYEANAYTQADGELLGTIATQASVAIQNARAYERLVETADELREIDRLKTQFLANMSHELRTPLNSIIGFSRVLLKGIDGPLTDLQEADLSSIYNSGHHLLSLINSILDMSKIEAGKIDLTYEEVDLSDIFKTVIATTRALVKDRPITLRVDVPDDLSTAWGDAQRVRQILINLLSNASKFTSEGEIVVQAREGPEFVTISVSDTGIGIKPEAQTRLFIPFQQVDGSTTRRAEGTGLGLAISRSFVDMMGGEIWVESEPGKGSTFCFTLPIYRAVREREEREIGVQLEPDKKTVLAVDDDAGVISLFKRYLENEGYQVIGVVQSPRAIETARRLAPHLSAITLDVVMPNLDGWQVLRSLKQDPSTRDIPVILCSIVEGLDQGLGLGAAACLRKPVTRDQVLEALKKVE